RGGDEIAAGLAWLVRDGVLDEVAGGYAFRDAALQDAIVDHILDERDLVHDRAFRYWAARPEVDAIERLTRPAFHGPGARGPVTAAPCWIALAHAARGRGELDIADDVLGRALACLTGAAPRLRATTQLERARVRHARGRFTAARDDARSARGAA